MDAAENMVLIGGPGTEESHVATALGVQAIEHHRKRVRFFSTVELVNALEQEKAQGKAGKIGEALLKTDLVILDEPGYLPFSASGGTLLFHLLSKLYECTSVIISSSLSFSEWANVFGDAKMTTALLDRFLHRAVVIQIEGASYRLRAHADLIPEHVRANGPIAPPPPLKHRGRPPKNLNGVADHSNRLIAETAVVGKFTSALLGKFKSALTTWPFSQPAAGLQNSGLKT